MTERYDPSCWVAVPCGIDRDKRLFPRGQVGIVGRSIPQLWHGCMEGLLCPASVWAWYWVGTGGSVHFEHAMDFEGRAISSHFVDTFICPSDEMKEVVTHLRDQWLAACRAGLETQENAG